MKCTPRLYTPLISIQNLYNFAWVNCIGLQSLGSSALSSSCSIHTVSCCLVAFFMLTCSLNFVALKVVHIYVGLLFVNFRWLNG